MDETHPFFTRHLTRGQLILLDLVAGLVIGFVFFTSAAGATALPPWMRIALPFALGAPLAVRRLWPLPVFLLTLVIAIFAAVMGAIQFPYFAPAYALYVVALTDSAGSVLPASAIATLSLVTVVGLAVTGTSQHRAPVWLLHLDQPLMGIAALGSAWTIGRAVHERRLYAARDAERLAVQAVTEERLRIARELHDVVTHSVGLIAVKAGVANHVLVTKPEEAHAALRVIETASRSALVEMRHLLGVLRSSDVPDLVPVPGLNGLSELVRQARLAGVDVRLELRISEQECVEDEAGCEGGHGGLNGEVADGMTGGLTGERKGELNGGEEGDGSDLGRATSSEAGAGDSGWIVSVPEGDGLERGRDEGSNPEGQEREAAAREGPERELPTCEIAGHGGEGRGGTDREGPERKGARGADFEASECAGSGGGRPDSEGQERGGAGRADCEGSEPGGGGCRAADCEHSESGATGRGGAEGDGLAQAAGRGGVERDGLAQSAGGGGAERDGLAQSAGGGGADCDGLAHAAGCGGTECKGLGRRGARPGCVAGGRLPAGVELAVYRIVQEALTNVVKHAPPARCRVSVIADGRDVRVEVVDDGPG
ncbi:MAG TPA: histidine kinase, partial [Nonomuraea sp.]|nr:histidine kinase [Nonomuraea sp.]